MRKFTTIAVACLIACAALFVSTAQAQPPYLVTYDLFEAYASDSDAGVISADTISAVINTKYADRVRIYCECDSISGTNPAYVLKLLVSDNNADWDTLVPWVTDSLEAELDAQVVMLTLDKTVTYFCNAGAAVSIPDSLNYYVDAPQNREGIPVLGQYLKVFMKETVNSGDAVFNVKVSVWRSKVDW